jgi:hypothetical protein
MPCGSTGAKEALMIRTYSELIRIPTFEERYQYLKLVGEVGAASFGYERYLNQYLYTSRRWKETRRGIILRDEGCDLAHEDYALYSGLLIHHLNPVTVEDVEQDRPCLYDPENLITTCLRTHNAIHYGSEEQITRRPIERRPNDTCPWR